MSIVSNSIINADAEARYLSPGELDRSRLSSAAASVGCASLKFSAKSRAHRQQLVASCFRSGLT